MVDVVRASSLVNVDELLRQHGADIGPFLRRAGIDAQIVGDYNRFMRYSALSDVIGGSAEELGIPDFALQLSRMQNLEMVGPIAVMARNAPTVEAALLGVVKYLHTYSPSIQAHLERRAGESRFDFEIIVPGLRYYEHMVELALGVILGMFRLLCGESVRPNRMDISNPRISLEAVYTEFFECPVCFSAERNSLFFPTSYLGREIGGGDGQAYQLATEFLRSRHRRLSIDQHVTELVAKLMLVGQATLPSVAAELMLHPRALQRQLADHGTTFDELLDDTRRRIAQQLLVDSDLPLSTVAQQLGYSEQSTLTRSCRRWFGMAPLTYRRGAG